jgi:O-acetylhomoserine/O-acetylserine sulfhydrylase-like pyridoxal-dependent enzyme
MIPISQLLEKLNESKLPMAAKGIYNGGVGVLLFFATLYLSNIDKKFESLENAVTSLSANVGDTSLRINVSQETTSWHSKELQRHSREIERQWDRIVGLEEAARNGGLKIPDPPKKVIPPVERK